MTDEPPSISEAVAAMSDAIRCLRLELPTAVFVDVSNRWRDVLDAMESADG